MSNPASFEREDSDDGVVVAVTVVSDERREQTTVLRDLRGGVVVQNAPPHHHVLVAPNDARKGLEQVNALDAVRVSVRWAHVDRCRRKLVLDARVRTHERVQYVPVVVVWRLVSRRRRVSERVEAVHDSRAQSSRIVRRKRAAVAQVSARPRQGALGARRTLLLVELASAQLRLELLKSAQHRA